MTLLDERPVLDQDGEEEIREDARRVAAAMLGQLGAEAPAVLRQVAATAAAAGRDRPCDGYMMFAEEAEKILLAGWTQN